MSKRMAQCPQCGTETERYDCYTTRNAVVEVFFCRNKDCKESIFNHVWSYDQWDTPSEAHKPIVMRGHMVSTDF